MLSELYLQNVSNTCELTFILTDCNWATENTTFY